MIEFIEYNGEHYVLQEPTIKVWSEVMKFKDILDEEELYIKMISVITGLSREDILKADASQITEVGEKLKDYLNKDTRQLYPTFEHKSVKYKLADFNKISFGQFVDIETFLKKDEAYRIANLNELAAYLYTEEGTSYSDSDFPKRIEEMRDIPVKYVESSLFFLLSLERGLQELSQLYSQNPRLWKIMKLRIALGNFGDGMQPYLGWLTTSFGVLTKLLIYPLYLVLTICRTYLTYFNKENRKLRKELKQLWQ